MLEEFFSNNQKTKTPLKTDELLEALRTMIVDGTLAPGSKLREVDLAAQFALSRTPVREALVALEREGMVTYALNRGFRVRQFSRQDLYEAYEMRALLEGYACGVVAQQGLPYAAIAELRACVDAVDDLLAAELDAHALVQWREWNIRFHALLMAQAPGGLLERTHRSIGRMPRIHDVVDATANEPQIRAKMQRYNEEHARILEAVVQRHSGRAEFLMREHIMQACALLGGAMPARAVAMTG
ncbi:GntR family transcriptional regulator [Alcaligenaceae bacterium C4P045]|nr:GntR family transcriptional regulator [Alcaligenaceae bacterium C4P045]